MQRPLHNLRVQLLSWTSELRWHTAQLWMIRRRGPSSVQTAIPQK